MKSLSVAMVLLASALAIGLCDKSAHGHGDKPNPEKTGNKDISHSPFRSLSHASLPPKRYFLLQAGYDKEWTAADSASVTEAGGKVFLSHAPTGLAYVSSHKPDFLDQVQKLRSFASTAEDAPFESDLRQASKSAPEVLEEVLSPENEPLFFTQWNMQAIEAPSAWAAGCTGAGARVAVICGGITDDHPDIAPNLDIACSLSTVDGTVFNEDGPKTPDIATHAAGIVAGAVDGDGITGVAPSAKLMHVKAQHNGISTTAQIVMGILFAADPASFETGCTKGADIINISLGKTWLKRSKDGLHSQMVRAMNFAASKGVLVITSAGNDAIDFDKSRDLVRSPGTLGSGITVSATGPVNVAFNQTVENVRRMTSYTNYGKSLVDLAGPGGEYTPYIYDQVLSSCKSPSTGEIGWCYAASTNIAAPTVAGVAALIKGKYPSISLGELKTKLFQPADKEGKQITADYKGENGKDKYYGHGFVNARRACTE